MATSQGHPHCCVCKTSYTYGCPGPYLLPCLHSICQECRDGTEDIICYACGKTYLREERDWPSLPNDTVTAKDVFLTTVADRPSELLCTNRDDGNQAMTWCEACEAFLCEHCQASHEEMKATRGHKVVSLQDLSCSFQNRCRSHHCSEHRDHPFSYYDKTCKMSICAKCALDKHRECDREDLDFTCSSLLASLEERKHVLTARQETLVASQRANKQHRYDLDEKQEQIANIIKHTFDQLRIVLHQREQEVNIQLNKCFDILKQDNHLQSQMLDFESNKHQATNDFIQKCLRMTDPIDLLSMRSTIDDRITSCTAAEFPAVRSQEGNVVFSRHGVQELHQNIASFGSFTTALEPYGSDALLKIGAENGTIILRSPDLAMSKERLNIDLVRMDERGFLACGSNTDLPERSPQNLVLYSGTVSREPLTFLDLQYWEIKVILELLQDAEKRLLFEIGVSILDMIDQQFTVTGQMHSFVMFLAGCDIHNTLCVKTRRHGRDTRCLKQIMLNMEGPSMDLVFGLAFNPENGTLAFFDIVAEEVLCVLDGIDTDKEYCPVFAVFNDDVAKVEMTAICGGDINIDAVKRELIERSLC